MKLVMIPIIGIAANHSIKLLLKKTNSFVVGVYNRCMRLRRLDIMLRLKNLKVFQ